MSQSDIQANLQQAITLAQSGQRTEARRLLEQVVEADPRQELAWMWLATVSTNRDERIGFLERALALNPRNTTAQEAYAQLTGQVYAPPPAAEPSAALPTDSRRETMALVRGGVILVVMLALLMLAAFVVAGQLVDDDSTGSRPIPTLRLTPDQQPGVIPTITLTPLPTRTPGPSPTSIWDVPPPTWTQAATSTAEQRPGSVIDAAPTSERFRELTLPATAEWVLTMTRTSYRRVCPDPGGSTPAPARNRNAHE
jgi:hypothetical protein